MAGLGGSISCSCPAWVQRHGTETVGMPLVTGSGGCLLIIAGGQRKRGVLRCIFKLQTCVLNKIGEAWPWCACGLGRWGVLVRGSACGPLGGGAARRIVLGCGTVSEALGMGWGGCEYGGVAVRWGEVRAGECVGAVQVVEGKMGRVRAAVRHIIMRLRGDACITTVLHSCVQEKESARNFARKQRQVSSRLAVGR